MMTEELVPLTLCPPAQLTVETRSEFRKLALSILNGAAANPGSEIVVDLSSNRAMDASGLGILLFLHGRAQEQKTPIRLINVPAHVQSLLTITRLEHIFQDKTNRI
jgi:anti-anti-sigma factor